MSLPGRFTIFVGGRPVVRPEGQGNEDEYFQARAGGPNSGSPPAVFEVKPSHNGLQLVSGEYALGRYQIEDLSLMPKRVGWCKRDRAQMLQPIQIEDGVSGPELRFSGAKLAIINDMLFTPLLDHEQNERVEIRPM
ncbi:uncharacterized protein FTOL_12275 [Fusarium torulosum]|uniref:Uncharacterized protein n=1 Tax=Fusarium torulosum TaxID=33205 RepID=A0AAE8MLC7_9HYPO|nr:uncharacterized protein FTOL_12275 [Fusarium torulosum]